MELSIAFVTLVISFITALFVFQNNPRSGTHVYFGLLVFFISLYPIFNYFAVNAVFGQSLIWAKFILLVSIPQGPLLLFFALVYPTQQFVIRKRLQIFIVLWVIFNLILASAGLIFKGVTVEDKAVTIVPGPLVPSFGLLHALTIVTGLYILFRKYRASKGASHRQLAYVFWGILVSFGLTFLITIILPIVLKNTVLLAISPLFLALSVVVVAYAIVSQRLFDIRAAVARSVAYVFSVGFVGLVYGSLIYSLFALFKLERLSDNIERLLFVGLALLTAIIYPPTKKFFDKVTTRLFYQDAYDPQIFLDQINKLLVSQIQLESLLKGIVAIIEDNLKASYSVFVIKETAYEPLRIIGKQPRHFSDAGLVELRKCAQNTGTKLFMSDQMEVGQEKLTEILKSMDISALIKLVSTASNDREGLGYLLIGPKKNGNIYSPLDKRVLDILANEMYIAVENSLRFEEIEEFNITLQEKVENATRELRRTNEKLKQLDETKDEFISMASHQLRTPLTSVKGYVSMVMEGDAGKLNPQQSKLLDQAFISSQRMVYLIADLLNVSRLKTGKFVIESKPTNLADLVEGELEQLTETAKGRNLELIYHKPKDFPDLMLDETKIRQVVMNFVDNAIYYTPAGGHIQVNIVNNPESIELTVVDDGLGVPKHEQPHLFGKFYRAGNAKKARPDGTGLGLFMAKKVVIAQGGSIIFRSEEGKGSTFGFTFAKSKLAVPAHYKADKKDNV